VSLSVGEGLAPRAFAAFPHERRIFITINTTTMRMASAITTIRRPFFRETNSSREKRLVPEKLYLQYLQVSACCGQIPPQLGQVCANILSDINEKYHAAAQTSNSTPVRS